MDYVYFQWMNDANAMLDQEFAKNKLVEQLVHVKYQNELWLLLCTNKRNPFIIKLAPLTCILSESAVLQLFYDGINICRFDSENETCNSVSKLLTDKALCTWNGITLARDRAFSLSGNLGPFFALGGDFILYLFLKIYIQSATSVLFFYTPNIIHYSTSDNVLW